MSAAISIPIFTSQLEKSKEATDMANIRAEYAEITAEYLGQSTATAITSGHVVNLKQSVDNWATTPTFPENLTISGTPKAGGTCTLTCDIDGAVTATFN